MLTLQGDGLVEAVEISKVRVTYHRGQHSVYPEVRQIGIRTSWHGMEGSEDKSFIPNPTRKWLTITDIGEVLGF